MFPHFGQITVFIYEKESSLIGIKIFFHYPVVIVSNVSKHLEIIGFIIASLLLVISLDFSVERASKIALRNQELLVESNAEINLTTKIPLISICH